MEIAFSHKLHLNNKQHPNSQEWNILGSFLGFFGKKLNPNSNLILKESWHNILTVRS